MKTIREKAVEYSGPDDVVCLHALAQPLVHEMQQVVRFQEKRLEQAGESIWYILNRLRSDSALRNLLGCGTESFERLTESFADISGKDVEFIRNESIPGSAAIHRPRVAA